MAACVAASEGKAWVWVSFEQSISWNGIIRGKRMTYHRCISNLDRRFPHSNGHDLGPISILGVISFSS